MIFARECNNPGSIPKALLQALEQMDKNDANVFTALCRISVKINNSYSPILINQRFDDYKEIIGIDNEQLSNFRALGLIEFDMGIPSQVYAQPVEKNPIELTYLVIIAISLLIKILNWVMYSIPELGQPYMRHFFSQ